MARWGGFSQRLVVVGLSGVLLVAGCAEEKRAVTASAGSTTRSDGSGAESGDHGVDHPPTTEVADTGGSVSDTGGSVSDTGGTATPQQRAKAEAILTATRAGLPRWADQDTAFAAGYVSIGDAFTGTEHLVNKAFIDDDVLYDPAKAESLVYDVAQDGSKSLAAAMYMLPGSYELDTAPDVAGSLIQWHVHDDLCFNPETGAITGIREVGGECRRGEPPIGGPMFHVWIRDHPCGPFAPLEGIGGGQVREGEEVICDHDSHS